MAREAELERALRAANERTKAAGGNPARRLMGNVTRFGAREAAKKALRPKKGGKLPAGLQATIDARRKALSVEAIALEPRFRHLFSKAEKDEARRRLGGLDNPSIPELVAMINEQAQDLPIGRLPKIRQRLRGLSRPGSRSIFSKTTTFEHYAFHHGGRTELQFNIAYERGEDFYHFRHGVGLSLQESQALPNIEVMAQRIGRFNEFVRLRGDELSAMRMWHSEDGVRSPDDEPGPIDAELFRPGVFIFLGRVQPAGSIDIDLILDSFQELLPVYEFVEGDQDFPYERGVKNRPVFRPGLTSKPSKTNMRTQARLLDRDLRHNEIQEKLGKYLIRKHGHDNVGDEQATGNGTSIDLVVKEGKRYLYYEIKTGLSARSCLREAIGQLLEYAYWPGARTADKLIVVGEAPRNRETREYLSRLRREFGLNIDYMEFSLTDGRPVKSID